MARRTCSRNFVVKLRGERNRLRRGVHCCDGGRESSANVKSFFAADFTTAVRPLIGMPARQPNVS